jgi:ankyrin repeat protein
MRKTIACGTLLFASLLVGTAWAAESEMITAIQAGDKLKVEALIAKGADVNAKYEAPYGFDTPLEAAARYGKKEVAELLIARGADVNAKDENGTTLLHSAAGENEKDIVELLIDKGAKVNARNGMGDTPLHKAAERILHKDVIELLIAKGADVNAKNNQGNTPLHYAVSNQSADQVELLIAKGSDVNAKNEKGETPLQVPRFAGNCLLANYAVDPGCKITERKIIALLEAQLGKGSNSQQALNIFLGQFKGHSQNDELRKSIIDLALKQRPGPTIPPEAEAAAGRGAYIFKNATSGDDTLRAAKELLTAIEVAPWVANYYINLCTVLEKSPYKQQALHACKLYLVAAPNAPDAGDMQQRIAGLQYAADRDKAQMKQRTAYIKSRGVEDLYRYGGISGTVSGKDITLKLVVDWHAAPPKYEIYAGCLQGEDMYGKTHDLVSTDNWMGFCNPVVNMHLILKPEGEGFVEVSDANGGSLRATLDDLFKAKQKTMAQAIMLSADGDGGERFFVTYEQGGVDLKHAGYAMHESDCNGSVLKKDPRALPDDFVSGDTKGFGRFDPEVNELLLRPKVDVCAQQFANKTGYHFGEAE